MQRILLLQLWLSCCKDLPSTDWRQLLLPLLVRMDYRLRVEYDAEDPTLQAISHRHGWSVAATVLQWNIQRGVT
eukprot:COSAG02_NODE_33112_length_505_cov_0.884236_1_plen_73_part_01